MRLKAKNTIIKQSHSRHQEGFKDRFGGSNRPHRVGFGRCLRT
jgi:hypothetical protein